MTAHPPAALAFFVSFAGCGIIMSGMPTFHDERSPEREGVCSRAAAGNRRGTAS